MGASEIRVFPNWKNIERGKFMNAVIPPQACTEANTESVSQYLKQLQDNICKALSDFDGVEFTEDLWERDTEKLGGGGRTRALAEGNQIEKGGVNYSLVTGESLPPSATANRPELAGRSYKAMGVSLVIHPRNPYMPNVPRERSFICGRKAR
ncbi:MAG: coproporphyrinogen III oxidase [Porticoccaceae bacterium]